jgi:hypothetical protein
MAMQRPTNRELVRIQATTNREQMRSPKEELQQVTIAVVIMNHR